MKIDVFKNLEKGKFKVDMKFKSFEMNEAKLIENFGAPSINVPAQLIYKICNSNASGGCVEIVHKSKLFLDESFFFTFTVDIFKFKDDDVEDGETKVQAVEKRVDNIIEVVRLMASGKMAELKSCQTDWEDKNNPTTIIF